MLAPTCVAGAIQTIPQKDTSKKFLHAALVGYNFLKRYKHFYLTNHVINSQYFEFSNFSQRKPIQ